MNTRDLKKTSQKYVQIRLIFQALSSISPKVDAFILPPYAWLESYGHHGSFGTNISGSLSFSPVLWVLSSRNTLNVTHSDTALFVPIYLCNSSDSFDSCEGCDSFDSSDSSGSCDSCDSSDSCDSRDQKFCNFFVCYFLWQNLKTQIVTKPKTPDLWQNSKTQIVTKLENSNCNKTQKLKLCQDSKIQTVAKLKNTNNDKTHKTGIVTTLKNL